MREYRIYFQDGSEEVVEAESISEAKGFAKEEWAVPVTRVVALEPVEPSVDDEDDSDDAEEEDDEEKAAE